jgi:hypothetical protein
MALREPRADVDQEQRGLQLVRVEADHDAVDVVIRAGLDHRDVGTDRRPEYDDLRRMET